MPEMQKLQEHSSCAGRTYSPFGHDFICEGNCKNELMGASNSVHFFVIARALSESKLKRFQNSTSNYNSLKAQKFNAIFCTYFMVAKEELGTTSARDDLFFIYFIPNENECR